MFVDFAIVLPIIFGGLLGFRDGTVRKIVSILVTFGAMFVAKLFMNDAGNVLVEQLNTDRGWAPLHAYLIIFFCILALQSLLYRVITGNYKIGGLADRITGSVLGAIHTALVVSVVLAVFEIKGFPSERTVRESRAYAPVRNVASAILNLVTQTVPQVSDTIEKLKEQGVGLGLTDTTQAAGKGLKEMIESDIRQQAEEALKKARPTDTTQNVQKKQ
jgi:membrane protein required for colicin V production